MKAKIKAGLANDDRRRMTGRTGPQSPSPGLNLNLDLNLNLRWTRDEATKDVMTRSLTLTSTYA
jgi:hypothetical protein